MDGDLTGDSWKLLQKYIQAVAGFEIVKQGLYRHAGSGKAGCAAHQLRVLRDVLTFHKLMTNQLSPPPTALSRTAHINAPFVRNCAITPPQCYISASCFCRRSHAFRSESVPGQPFVALAMVQQANLVPGSSSASTSADDSRSLVRTTDHDRNRIQGACRPRL